MTEWVVPDGLASAAEGNAALRAWVGRLPQVVALLVEEWGLESGPLFQPGGQCSWVAPVTGPDGADAVLKVAWRHPEARAEAQGLRHWAGQGAVRLFEHLRLPDTDVLLLERCRPGTPLGKVLAEPEQDVVVADVLRRLWGAGPAGDFPTLAATCAAWADEAQAGHASQVDPVLPPDVVARGLHLFRSLAAPSAADTVLATDCHAGNVLAASRVPWLLVDPKPHLGDPAYDVVQHLLNCRGRLLHDPRALVARVAALAGVDGERARLWLFARAVQESAQSPWLAEVALETRPD